MSRAFSRLVLTGGVALAAAGLSLLTTPAHAVNLTGVTLFDSDLISVWNTQGGDGGFNLYMSDFNFSPLNSGDSAEASINYALSSGDNDFFFSGDTVPQTDLILALYFDGANTTNRIAAGTTASNTAVAPPPIGPITSVFNAYSGTVYAVDLSQVSGSGALSFQTGNTVVTLTNFDFTVDPLFDSVSPFSRTPNAVNDTVGSFTLNVSTVAVPEAGTAALALPVLLGAAGVIVARRRKVA